MGFDSDIAVKSTSGRLTPQMSRMDTEFGQIPTEWNIVTLGTIVSRLENGLSYQETLKKEGIPITRIETIAAENVDPQRVGYVADLSADLAERYRLKPGDILFSHINSVQHIGKTAVYQGQPPLLIHGMNLLLIRANAKLAEPLFLAFALKYGPTRNRLRSLAKQAINQASINTTELRSFRLALPSLAEQRKIATILSTVDDNIQKTQQIIEKTEELKKGLMQRLLTRGIDHTKFKQTEIGEIPEEWEIGEIVDFSNSREESVQTGPFGAQLHAHDYLDEGIPLIRIVNVIDGRIVDNDLVYISPKKASELSRYRVKTGDIVFSRVGSVGRAALVRGEQDGWLISGQMLRVRLDNPQIDNVFLGFVIASTWFQDALASRLVGSTRKSINTEILSRLPLVAPKLPEQQHIAAILSTVDDRIAKECQRKANLEQLKKGLMQVLLTGKVRVKNV